MSVRILIGDCVERMKELPDSSVDSVVCDPPYHLTAMTKPRPDLARKADSTKTRAEQKAGINNPFASRQAKTRSNCGPKVGKLEGVNAGQYKRLATGFMGQTWDGGDVAFQPATWAEVLRVLKPGGHLVAFSGTRTYHRMAVAIEDAGFEVRDMCSWIYSTGFPKSLNVGKQLDGTSLVCHCGSPQVPQRDLRVVPSDDVPTTECDAEECSDVLFSCLPESGLSEHRAARSEPEPSREKQSGVEGGSNLQKSARELQRREVCSRSGVGAADGPDEWLHHGTPLGHGDDVRLPADQNGSGEPQGSQPGEQSPVEPGTVADECGSQAWGGWPVCGGCSKPIIPEGLGSALKPAFEPICLARKPLSEKSIAANVLKWGTGAINVDGCRIGAAGGTRSAGEPNRLNSVYGDGMGGLEIVEVDGLGRWPANLCHDGSDEVVAGFPESENGRCPGVQTTGWISASNGHGVPAERNMGDSGSAARFFYTAKASSEERGAFNNHPTVKPIALMRWLVRLVTPKGGTVLDPFMGSGSTLIAADAEQFTAIGCELSPEYAAIAERRIRDAAGMFADVTVSRAPDDWEDHCGQSGCDICPRAA